MKTPNEIRNGLEHCGTKGTCDGCPYHSLGSGKKCIPALCADAFDYAKQLETMSELPEEDSNEHHHE